jgi:hypothetical protein
MSPNASSRELPPSCTDLSTDPQQTTTPPRWLGLIPDVVLGLDYRADSRVYTNDGSRLLLTTPDQPTTASLAHHDHQDSMTRWTINLRWSADPTPRLSTTDSNLAPTRCDDLHQLYRLRPTDLAEAIDLWATRATLAAILDPSSGARAHE